MSLRSLFFLIDTATTEIYPLSLHVARPIFMWGALLLSSGCKELNRPPAPPSGEQRLADRYPCDRGIAGGDRKGTRLNSHHSLSSYGGFSVIKKTKHRSPTSSRWRQLYSLIT